MHTIQSKNVEDFKEENQKGIDNHKKIAEYLQAAAKYHHDAAQYLQANNTGKAAQSGIIAQGLVAFAVEAERNDTIHHSTYN